MKQNAKRSKLKIGLNSGFTLLEVLIAAAMLALTTTSVLLTFLNCFELREVSTNYSLAMQAARRQMENIKSTSFYEIQSTFGGGYPSNIFAVGGLDGMGVTYVENADGTAVVSFNNLSMNAGSTTLTSGNARFDSSMVGVSICITSGTNFIPGEYSVMSYINANNIVLNGNATNGTNATGGGKGFDDKCTGAVMYKVTVAVSWRQRSGRVYGEDTNVNGNVDGSEDVNGNSKLDSPAELVSYIFNK